MNATPVNATAFATGLISVNVRVVEPFGLIGLGENALLIVGGAITVTVLEPVLFASLFSAILLFGSTVAVLAKLPAEAGVAVKLTAKLPVVAPIVTDAPLAIQLNVPAVMLQLILAELVIPTKLPVVGAP